MPASMGADVLRSARKEDLLLHKDASVLLVQPSVTSDVVQGESSFWYSRRFLLAVIGFFGTFNLYSLRVSMSVAIVCMVNHTAIITDKGNINQTEKRLCGAFRMVDNQTVAVRQTDGPYAWDLNAQGLILGAYFWGYCIPQIPAGIACQLYGARRILLISILTYVICTILMPVSANLHIYALVFLRFISGFSASVWFPCMSHIWSRWAPPDERSKLCGFTYAGMHLGVILTMPLSGILCQHGFAGGWPSIFYVFGVIGLLWVIWCFYEVYDDPEDHPRISKVELKYIKSKLRGQVRTADNKIDLPLKTLFKSVPFWALVAGNVGYDWGGYAFMTNIPKYFNEVLHFNIQENGALAALPYVGFWIMSMTAAVIADILISTSTLSVGNTRKLATSLAFVIPATLVLGVAHLECQHRYIAVILLIVALSAKGFAFGGFFVNHVDIAPRYAGIMMGFSNSIAAATGFIGPPVLGALTSINLVQGWRIFFYITAVIYIVFMVLYCIMASGTLQPWAAYNDDEDITNGETQNIKELKPLSNANHIA